MKEDLDAILRTLSDADCLADQAMVEAAIERMAGEISERLADTNPLIYVVMNGGLILAGKLLPRLHFPLEVAYLHATRYGDALCGHTLEWRVPPTEPPRDRTVLVIDDILDEGHTLAAILSRLEELGARQVRSAVLVHKTHERKAIPGMRADFTGLDVADRFLFGYGMDYKGYWRNAPGIYALKGH
ncbi:hypoxanthine-guanine phosphoribosyltransferase [Nitrogeniibacter mangrovi]|uniref:Hypoxanthine-guanine phosphoribosyltransferase n=1 Tax=Nitrogeniibacter mangrovi TaxID=2016596 RepID=A0A6C1AYN1_9RHOO|nr:hypoxanthine-guanine phosphoribosyltransferase [Nitrogeniibacter mangrovi]QID16447.1 hypoxanthine-guanine phosphoribosyltransferase [Nitrogeniibacter mangrovi]